MSEPKKVKAERLKAKGEEAEKPPAADRSAPSELQTANSKLQTENMEVHHHPDLHHAPKPWKEYLLEGLMIFLAVTMGFFAESLRERISDGEREKQAIESLVKCLSSDTIQLKSIIK